MTDDLVDLEIQALKLEVMHEVVDNLPTWKLRTWFDVSDVTKQCVGLSGAKA